MKTIHIKISDDQYGIVYVRLKNNNNFKTIDNSIWKSLNLLILRVKDPMNVLIHSYYYNLLYPSYIHNSALQSLQSI